MMRRRAAIPLLAAVLLLTACSSNPAPAGPRTDRNLLSKTEIEAAGYTDAFTAVQSLRPQWLRARGVSSLNQSESIKVYLDGSLLGGTDQLKQITTRSISSIRYYDALEATQRWGLDHGLGAIVVSTRET